ncbi:nicotinamidase-related amidase [Sphingobium xanthum]|jgi:nicotinamidase-related amidase|uniref:cysteine hydrolase family protein n=1 Tax=Sphingobium xanthum TaxID=1387165 RepID=UPI001C8BC490|nr:isochorismatase family cysteine hydrolase [Sphingobium xanthum]
MADAATLPHVGANDLKDMLTPATTALVVVDVQTDFASPEGLLGRVGTDLSSVPPALANIIALIATARKAGATLAFMRVVTSPKTDSNALKTLMARKGMPGGEAICRSDDGGADYHVVTAEPGDIQIDKLLYDSFHGTDLDAQLRARGIETLLITGFSTDCCVDQTARAAFHRDYHAFIVSDACAAYDDDLHVSALNILQKNCALLVASEAVLSAWAR